MRRLLILPLLVMLLGAAPYANSAFLTDMILSWLTHEEVDFNADNWPATWHDDGEIYMTFGDGGGLESGAVSTSWGIGKLTGPWATYIPSNVFGGNTPDCTYDTAMNGKSRSMASINTKLYSWWNAGGGGSVYNEQRLVWSADDGCTWTKHADDYQDTVNDIHSGHIVNVEQGGDQARADGFVYEIWVHTYDTVGGLQIQCGGTPDAGRIHLTRVTPANIENYASREWFTGTPASPTWGAHTSKTAIFEDPNCTGWNASMSWVEDLGRYIFMTEHTDSGFPNDGSAGGCLGVYESENPWGPWLTVEWWSCVGDDWFGFDQLSVNKTNFFWNFPLKWVEADVATSGDFILFFTGAGNNDSWNGVEASFTVVPEGGEPPPGGVLGRGQILGAQKGR